MQERAGSDISNREFLCASNIRVDIDYDIERNFDRIVELINGAGDLNYTGSRLRTQEEIEAFRNDLTAFAHHAGCVCVSDDYADYGLAGFFQMRQKPKDRRLIHFVFSCRVMNMGIEQYVYRLLGKPELDSTLPDLYAANEPLDWINARPSGGGGGVFGARGGKLVLLGGCDLLQVASYCSADRLEFVNRAEDDEKIRYDDFGFVLSGREEIRHCEAIRSIPCWNYDDAVRFDSGLADAGVVILSLLQGMNGYYYDAGGGVWFRLNKRLARPIRKRDPEWFDATFRELDLDFDARLRFHAEALDAIAGRVRSECKVFVLGAYTRIESKANLVRRRALYNENAREFCASHSGRFSYVDLDALVPAENAIDAMHFTRETYFALARHMLGARGDAGSA